MADDLGQHELRGVAGDRKADALRALNGIIFQERRVYGAVRGVEFFRKAVELQKQHLPADKKIINGIQTNGTTLDDEWCEFLGKENFYVGLSLDGPRELHDHYRVTKGQKPTRRVSDA